MMTASNYPAWFVSPENLILKKMDFFREGASDRHLRDIVSMLKISGDQIDRDYISTWAKKLELDDIWQRILTETSK